MITKQKAQKLQNELDHYKQQMKKIREAFLKKANWLELNSINQPPSSKIDFNIHVHFDRVFTYCLKKLYVYQIAFSEEERAQFDEFIQIYRKYESTEKKMKKIIKRLESFPF